MDNIASKSSCLCGSVTIFAQNISRKVEVCHCTMCQKWGGGPAFSVDCGNSIEIDGIENVGVYDSSDWAERGFCIKCGTHLYYKLKEPIQYIIPVGLFSELSDFTFDKQIFIDEKPDYYCFANKTKLMTGAEVYAEYSS